MNKIILTKEQNEALIKLWFIYGNRGKKHTALNHKYIQAFLETGKDLEKEYRNADKGKSIKAGLDWLKIQLTDECVNAVKEVLK